MKIHSIAQRISGSSPVQLLVLLPLSLIPSGTQAHKAAFSAKFVYLITIFLSFSLLLTSCKKDSDDLTGVLGLLALGGSNPKDPTACGSDLTTAGEKATCTVNSVSFKMAHVPGGITIPTGTDDSGSATVSNGYQIAETEVTYELWSTVHTWATSNGYTFANAGTMGDGTGDTNQHPVTTINWRDAMVWMNALTEYYNAQNGTSLKPVYYSDSDYTTPIRDSSDGSYGSSVNSTAGSFDNPYIYAATTANMDMASNTADGFRLPSADEWELAARYIDDANGDGDIQDAGEYYPGDYASGATADCNDATATGNVAVYDGSSTAVVKSKSANALGLYDMSGNVWEWNFDWYTSGSSRVIRGGSWHGSGTYLQVSGVLYDGPYSKSNSTGFRPSRSP